MKREDTVYPANEGGPQMATATAKQKAKEEADRAAKAEAAMSTRKTLITKHLLDRIGRPPGYDRTDVYHLWASYFRVNVRAKTSEELYTSPSIVDSYFLVANSDGEILRAEPELTLKN